MTIHVVLSYILVLHCLHWIIVVILKNRRSKLFFFGGGGCISWTLQFVMCVRLKTNFSETASLATLSDLLKQLTALLEHLDLL